MFSPKNKNSALERYSQLNKNGGKIMGALGEVGTVTEIAPNAGVKVLMLKTPVTFIGGTDTIAIDLNNYGCTKVSAIFATYQSTEGGVTADATIATTSNTAGVLVLTPSSSGTGVYGIIIYAY